MLATKPATLFFSFVLLLGATTCQSTKASKNPQGGGNCRVDLWSVPWDQEFQTELDEDAILRGNVARRHRVPGCEYANQVRALLNRAALLPAGSVPPGGDFRLTAQVTTGASSWLIAVPVTCRWMRLDRTHTYRLDAPLIRLLIQGLAAEDAARIRAFGSCDLGDAERP